MGLLEVTAADLGAGDVGGDGEHRDAAAMGVEQSVDQVEVTGTATAHADREFAGESSLGGGCESSGFLVADMLPGDGLGAA